MKLYRARKNDLHMVFIDVKEVYDRVLHAMLCDCLGDERDLGGIHPSF